MEIGKGETLLLRTNYCSFDYCRQGGSSSLSDHSDRSSASVQTVYKLDTPSKEPSPEVPLELQSTTVDATMDRPIAACDDANVQQEKLSLTSSSSEDSSDENFGDSCCGNITGHSAETYHRYVDQYESVPFYGPFE